MPRHCPECNAVVEVKRYAVPSGKPAVSVAGASFRVPTDHLEHLDVWECDHCLWAEDVDE